MTREEEIIQEAKHHEREEGFTQIVKDTKGIYSAYGIGFLEGAEWADKTMLDKVCKVIEEMLPNYVELNCIFDEISVNYHKFKNNFISDLRKAIEKNKL